jgi:putative hemolysin
VAVILDEYGGITGVTSYDNIVAALLGRSETTIDAPQIVAQPDGTWVADGHADIRDVEETLDLSPLDAGVHRGYRTLAGFMLARIGKVPAVGEIVRTTESEFRIMAMDRRRIARVSVHRLGASPPSR